MTDPAIIAAGITVATQLLTDLAKSLTGTYDVGCAIVNGTKSELKLIGGIKEHHGQYTNPPPSTLAPLPDDVKKEEEIHSNIELAALTSVGAACSEAIFGFDYDISESTYRVCFYLKHGKHIEAGCAIWKKGSEVDGEDYDGKIDNSAESLIHTIQKERSQTAYSKDGEGATISECGIKVSFSSGHTVRFVIEDA